MQVLRLFALMIAALVAAGCQGVGPSASRSTDGSSAPPTQLERSMLGPDADDTYFLSRFRSCAAFGSYTYCQAEMYGGLPQ
jgi:hypothetical protein